METNTQLADRIKHLESRKGKLYESIWDTEYELEYHNMVEMAEVQRNKITGKNPLLYINGQPMEFSRVVTETIKNKTEGLRKLKEEVLFIDAYIDRLRKDGEPPSGKILTK